MSGILLRQSGYYFRKVLPKDVQKVVGKREVQASLKTSFKRLAKDKANYLSLQLNTAIHELRVDFESIDRRLLIERFHTHVTNAVQAIRKSDKERLPIVVNRHPKLTHLCI